MRITVQPVLPEAVTDYRYQLLSVVFLLRKESAHQRRDPKGWQHPARQPSRIHLRRLSNTGQFVTQSRIATKVLEAVRIPRVGADIRSRDASLTSSGKLS